MQLTHYKSRLQQILAQRNGYLVLAALLAVRLFIVDDQCLSTDWPGTDCHYTARRESSFLGGSQGRLSRIFIANGLFFGSITTESHPRQCGLSAGDFTALHRSGLLRRFKK